MTHRYHPDAYTIEWWRSRIRAVGDKLIEGTVVDMLCLLEVFGYDLDKVTARNIGQLLGVIDHDGNWL